MSAILKSLQRLLEIFERENIPYMIIGGYALPHYGRIRTTIDIDLAVAVNEKKLDKFRNLLDSVDFELTISSPLNPMVLALDRREKIEIELWLRPDGITFDDETLKRRRRVKMGSFEAWIVSPEDFIVNKLARPDRGVKDEQDVKSVLIMQNRKLDEEYLKKRAEDAQVSTILKYIQSI